RIPTSSPMTVSTVRLTVNGSSSAISLEPASIVYAGVQYARVNPCSCVSLYQTGVPDGPYLSFMYVSGRSTLPFTMPSTAGTYERSEERRGRIQRIATSSPVTAGSISPAVNGSSSVVSIQPESSVNVG